MAHTIETVELLSSSPGARRSLKVHRIGNRGARPKVYVQAALHANETPGLLILHHLLDLALQADNRGEVLGELVLVPFANPIGLSENGLDVRRCRQWVATDLPMERPLHWQPTELSYKYF